MSEKKKFLLRIDNNIYAALEKWAADDLRSINSQIEYLLTNTLKKSGRLKEQTPDVSPENPQNSNPTNN